MPKRILFLALVALAVSACTVFYSPSQAQTGRAKEPLFLLHQIGTDHAEGVSVFDMDRDGLLDVASGAYWYKAPDWTKYKFREAKIEGEFVSDCGEFAIDRRRDGYPDIIASGWMDDGIFLFENPKQVGVEWKRVQITPSRQTEGLISVDIDGDGIPDILPSHWTKQPIYWVQVLKDRIVKRPISDIGGGHGVGFGDVDGDGKGDVITPNGWYRQIDLAHDKWEWHPEFQLHEAGLSIYAYDFNGDGLPDILYGRGHSYGLYWLEQRKDASGKRSWIEHPIDLSFSQVHNVKMVDLNGDGIPEILAGKRYRGHNEKDEGSFDPLAIYYYTFKPGKDVKFERHTLAYNAIVGAGTQFVVVDLDGDGDLDIVCAGKTGQYWFENLTINKVPWQKRDILFDRYPSRQ